MRFLGSKKYLRVASAIGYNFFKGEAVYPFYASLKLTNRCHFRCSFCNVWKEKTPELPTEEFCRLLENLGHSSVILVSFEGGEPLLRKDLEELLRFHHQRKKPPGLPHGEVCPLYRFSAPLH